jgi:predicted acetylornithine/succinylornithine family transaminase
MENIFEKEKELFIPTYNRIPLEITHGKGVYLFDKNGNQYLDFFSGLAVNALGYAHPGIVKAVSEQIAKFAHLSNYYITDVQVEFAEKLLKYSGMNGVFLANSGTEAIEGVLKMIRLKVGPDKTIFSMDGSFHGRTYGALSLTAREKYKKGFEPMLPNTSYILFNDIKDLEAKINENTGAVIFEFIQGEGGINELSKEFVDTLFNLKKIYNFLIVEDAIQDGVGRSGKGFVHEYFDVKPDIITTAKAIGGGLPLGAILVNENMKNILTPGQHGTTFGGNPVSCAAGKVVLEEVFENGLLESVYELGNYFKINLNELKKKFPDDIREIRGKGFMLGVDMAYDCSDLVKKIREKKVLVNCTNNTVVRILPPLISTKKEIDLFLNVFEDTLSKK